MTRIFVGIPTLNRPQLVEHTVRSVLAQTCEAWEMVVSDNVSAPAAQQQVRQFVAALGHARVRFHVQPDNVGEYGQGRTFLAEAVARGCDHLMILHDDDTVSPTYLARALAALDAHPQAAFFVCNPTIIDDAGQPRPDWTQRFDERWGRSGARAGLIDVLDSHMRWGFTPITGAVFRVAALQRSGFVDGDMHGCFPFETNIFLRLGECGAQAVYTPERLLQLRWHSQQMTNWGFLNQASIVEQTIRVFERRRFDGVNERRRRQVLGRLQRVWALHRAQQHDARGARRAALACLRHNPASLRNWLVGGCAFAAPGLVGHIVRRTFQPTTFAAA